MSSFSSFGSVKDAAEMQARAETRPEPKFSSMPKFAHDIRDSKRIALDAINSKYAVNILFYETGRNKWQRAHEIAAKYPDLGAEIIRKFPKEAKEIVDQDGKSVVAVVQMKRAMSVDENNNGKNSNNHASQDNTTPVDLRKG